MHDEVAYRQEGEFGRRDRIPDNLRGLVLCGGKSSRMGQDKGLLKCGNITWASLAISKFDTLGIQSGFSINKHQCDIYSTLFENRELIVDDELEQGPVGAFLSFANAHKNTWVIVLACDLPLVSPGMLERLLLASIDRMDRKNRINTGIFDNQDPVGVIYKSSRGLEPLCGLYSPVFLNEIVNRFNHGEREFGLMGLIRQWEDHFVIMELDVAGEKQIRNFNTPEELANLQKLCAQEDSNLRPFDS